MQLLRTTTTMTTTATAMSMVLLVLQLLHCDVVRALPRPGDGRIVGGVEAPIHYFPYQLSLQFESTHICGASLIDARIALTAAHCVTEFTRPQLYTVRAGSAEHERGGMTARILRIVPHERYNIPTTLNNDIALLVLQTPIPFSRSVQPISLITVGDVLPVPQVLFVSGWGALSSEMLGIMPRLRYTVVQELNHRNCSRAYIGAGTVTATMLCAGVQGSGGRDSCQGDSGGPLVARVGGLLKLYGIVSWGIGCAHPDYPGVYTRVSMYDQWVKQTRSILRL